MRGFMQERGLTAVEATLKKLCVESADHHSRIATAFAASTDGSSEALEERTSTRSTSTEGRVKIDTASLLAAAQRATGDSFLRITSVTVESQDMLLVRMRPGRGSSKVRFEWPAGNVNRPREGRVFTLRDELARLMGPLVKVSVVESRDCHGHGTQEVLARIPQAASAAWDAKHAKLPLHARHSTCKTAFFVCKA